MLLFCDNEKFHGRNFPENTKMCRDSRSFSFRRTPPNLLCRFDSPGGGVLCAGCALNTPQWSPDGRLLSFPASRNERRTQVWALNLRGGESRRLTHVEQGVNDYARSPDANSNSDIRVVAADNPDAGATLLRSADNPGSDSSQPVANRPASQAPRTDISTGHRRPDRSDRGRGSRN